MEVLIRADSSNQIGSGHVMRCMTLGNALRAGGAKVSFICRTLDGSIVDKVRSDGFQVYELQSPNKELKSNNFWLGVPLSLELEECLVVAKLGSPDLIIVDHYGLDEIWHRKMKAVCAKLMVIDDLANRTYYCDALLDQTFGRCVVDYKNLVPSPVQLFLGSQYALLRPQFAEQRKLAEIKRRKLADPQKLLISLGGTDPFGYYSTLIECLGHSDFIPELVVVISSKSPFRNNVIRAIKHASCNVSLLEDVSNMADVVLDADMAIGAAGSSAWERCVLGLPTLMLVLADNQKLIANELSNALVSDVVEDYSTLSCEELLHRVYCLWNDVERRMEMSDRAFNVCDGLGAERVAQKIRDVLL